MQRTRAIPVAWLNSGLCPDRPKGWIPIIIIIIIIYVCVCVVCTNTNIWVNLPVCYSSRGAMKISVQQIWMFWTLYHQPIQRPGAGYVCSKAGLLARNQFASSFSTIFLGPRANPELASIIHIALQASKAALAKINFNFFLRLTQPSRRGQNFVTMLPSTHKIQPSSLPISFAAHSQ